MSDYDQLLSKSKEDLEAIAVQFGDFTAEVAATKTREELIAAISGTPVQEEKPKKAPAKKTSTRKKKSEEETAVESKDEEKPKKEVKKAAAKKTASKTSKKTEEKAEDKEEPKAEDKPEDEAPKKPSRAKKANAKKASSKKEENISIEEIAPAAEEVKAEEAKPSEEEAKPKAKKTAKRSSKKKAEEPSQEEASNEAAPAEEPSKEAPVRSERPAPKSKKRRISFGPEQTPTAVDIPAEEKNEEQQAEAPAPAPEIQYREVEGILSIGGENRNDFCGFVHRNNYLPGEDDAYVPGQMIKRLGLRKGDKIKGLVAPARGKEKYAPLRKVISVNGIEIPEDSDFDVIRKRPRFESLTAIYPDKRLDLETGAEDLSTRIIDLFSPIGKGQRGMIVSPPKAGKTILLKKVANSITANNPNCKVIVLLIDERPEEVTDMQRSIKGEVVYSTFDKRPENHVRVTELVLERAMRLVELGEDVVILLDSMTRLARAYNLTINPTGRTLSGGLDPGSLYGPKRFFGAARNIEFGGSLTIIATALIETGSRMDEVIFEEFKGTGNMEVVLDRRLADRRIYPAIAVDKSGTRREDLLLTPEELESVWLTRKAIAEVDTLAATSAVINFMKRTTSNASFVLSAKKSFSVDS
ncbi:MAG: transcription termination factor Rho [Saccharofermentans sp.]|nr:transcription termination factor Rho [Saccharofermentans sp.]